MAGAMTFPLMGTKSQIGRYKQGATRLGISLEEYTEKRNAGLRWCFGHQDWEPWTLFGPHSRQGDGLDTRCLESARAYAREYQRRKRAQARRTA